jgi:hypothetical protein
MKTVKEKRRTEKWDKRDFVAQILFSRFFM